MRVTTVSVTCGRKINAGDFNSIHLELSMTAELDASDDAEAVRRQLWAEATASLREQTAPFLKKRQDQVDEVRDGLPSSIQEHMT